VAVPGDRHTVVSGRCIALLNHVWLDVGVLWAQYLVTFSRHVSTVETHTRRAGDDLPAVVSVVADAD
jgi:hypothetical protein